MPAAKPANDEINGAEASASKPLAHPCPCCGGRMIVIETFEARRHTALPADAPRHTSRIDTS